MSATHKLAQYAAESKYEDLPKEVVEKAKLLILDTLGCEMAGSKTPPGQKIIQTMKELGGKPQASIAGDGTKISCVNAGYVNAHLADALDFDDTLGHLGHPAATIIPGAMAAGEYVKSSGKDLITAVVMGYEVSIRIAFARRPSWLTGYPPIGGKPVGVGYCWHSFGAGVSAGKIFGLDKEKMASCIGLTAAATPLISKTHEEGATHPFVKGYNFAEDAAAGVLGALLARNGFLGCDTILDGPDGFWIMSGSDRCDFERLTQKLGEEYEITKVGIKPWSCCRNIHATCDAVKYILDEHQVKENEIEEVVAKTYYEAMFSQHRPKNIYDAEFSVPWCVAMVIRNERCGLDWYREEHFKNPEVLNLLDRVRLVHDPEADRLHQFPMRKWVSTVIIETKDGRRFSRYVDSVKGDPENPMSVKEVKDKFRIQASSISLKDNKIEEIINKVDRLEELDDVSKLAALLSP